MPRGLPHKVFSKDAVKGELPREGQERGRTVWPFKRHIPVPSEIVGSVMGEMTSESSSLFIADAI